MHIPLAANDKYTTDRRRFIPPSSPTSHVEDTTYRLRFIGTAVTLSIQTQAQMECFTPRNPRRLVQDSVEPK